MTSVPPRGGWARRGGRGPGWTLLTALLVLAVVASAALVFTSRVELLKLGIIVALWAAVVAAFVSVIYRRQSDADRARARDLKLVYNLQLDREISARREYELTVEAQLRRELASELRDQAADEVAALRSELSALRNNLEILFDSDLGDRPALENERTTVRAYSDWARADTGPNFRVSADREAADHHDTGGRTAENPIIDVSEVGVPAAGEPMVPPWQPVPDTRGGFAEAYQGSPRDRPDGGTRSGGSRWSPQERPPPYRPPQPRAEPEPAAARHEAIRQPPPAPKPAAPAAHWQPTAAEGQWLPPGTPGSNWVSDFGAATGDRPVDFSATYDEPGGPPPPARHGRHASAPEPTAGPPGGTGSGRHHRETEQPAPARHSGEPVRHAAETASDTPPSARHRGADPGIGSNGSATGGQSVADLLARMQTSSTGGRRRRRRDE